MDIPRTITINGIDFTPLPGVDYTFEYVQMFDDVAAGKYSELAMWRHAILNDLWFIVYFVLGEGKNSPRANHPFIIKACQEVQEGPVSDTLDLWAREHFKSTIITVAETIQYALKDPDQSTCIFSYARPVAKKFLFEIKSVFENSRILKACFPDVIWENPESQAPIWSLDDGLILRRKGTRKEPTIMAAGLVEGMPTGMHYNRMIFDDIVTEDIATSIDVMEKVKLKFDSAQNLGTDGGVHRVIGTYYHHNDPLVYIAGKKDMDDGVTPAYSLRLKPATDNGEVDGKPVLLSEERFKKLKGTATFNCQQLLNPTPIGTRKLDSSMMQDISRIDIPEGLYKFMMVDPAGEGEDSWGIFVCGVEPVVDEIGASNVYILDCVIDNLQVSHAIEMVTKMYMRNGIIEQMGIEKTGLSTMEIHVANALNKFGRRVSIEDKTLVLLKPAGRVKVTRVENALAWPLLNSKIFISSYVPATYRAKLQQEMDQFPFGKHDDGIDALSYLYDMLHDYGFKYRIRRKIPKFAPIQMFQQENSWMGM